MSHGYGPRQTRVWRNLARSLKVAAGGRCAHCQRDVGVENLELDHITSLIRGGPAIPPPSGLQVLCRPCHRSKSARAGDVARAASSRDRRYTP
jgi:5-methylcytosine-specific restriction endonuclease McrA